MIQMYLITALVSALLSFGTAWTIQGWRYDFKLSAAEARTAVATQKAEQAAREAERAYTQRVEEIANNAAQRQQVLEARAVATERVARSLRDDIARLASRQPPADTEAARYALEATRARELLGTCADEYRGVAVAADALRDQVTGLQGYARAVSGDPK